MMLSHARYHVSSRSMGAGSLPSQVPFTCSRKPSSPATVVSSKPSALKPHCSVSTIGQRIQTTERSHPLNRTLTRAQSPPSTLLYLLSLLENNKSPLPPFQRPAVPSELRNLSSSFLALIHLRLYSSTTHLLWERYTYWDCELDVRPSELKIRGLSQWGLCSIQRKSGRS